MREEWRPVKGFEDYFVSCGGNVISTKTGKILKPHLNHKGYHVVTLYKESKGHSRRVHRLVADAFLPNPDKLPEVDHINAVRNDNEVTNLRWVSGSENTRNRDYSRKATSKYNGVMKKKDKWQVNIFLAGKTKHIGIFIEEHLAALAFNNFCIENNLDRELNIIEEA
jgi:hypothetical protein